MAWKQSRRGFMAASAPAVIAGAAFPAWARASATEPGAPARSGVRWSPPDHRDIRISDWGPYSDHWNGIAHIAERERGLRMDFALAPAVLRRETLVPYAEMGLAMQPLRAASDLSYIAWECRMAAGIELTLEWLALPAGGTLRATAHNRTATALPLLLNWVARLAPPLNPARARLEEASGIPHRTSKGAVAQPADVALPPSGLWIDALSYARLDWATPRFDDALVFDGRRRGEVFEDGFVASTGVGQGFGHEAGDRVEWQLDLAQPYRNAVLRMRYRVAGGTARFRASGLVEREIACPAGEDGAEAFRVLDIAIGALAARPQQLALTALGGAAIELDGFALCEADELAAVGFPPHRWDLTPQRRDLPAAAASVLMFPGELDHAYAIGWNGGTTHLSQVRNDDLRTLDWALNDPSLFAMSRVPETAGPASVTIAAPAVIDLGPGEEAVRDLFVATGAADGVAAKLAQLRTTNLDPLFAAARGPAPHHSAAAAVHAEGAERLLATIATNMLFPIWTGGTRVCNYSPGREWPSVYTWDSGFSGIGLARAAPDRSIALLDTYLSPVDDVEAAFLHHGTPLPTQFYQFQELWNRSGDLAFARERYPRLARYHRFLMGREAGSTCRTLGSGMIRTFDYFYNSGGMDDYPAQMAIHRAKKADRIAPVINTAHAIRCAKLLCQIAGAIGAERDLGEWREDIASLTAALQQHSWDEASGYFAFVEHDRAGQPVGHLRSPAGENFNMGLDGASPLVADICAAAQRQRLIEHLFTPGRLWTPHGITAVDQRASYFTPDGYWNGTVWMPHQWFMWKALLDCGEGERAWQIARTALEVYSAEIRRSGRAYENFDARTGIGSAWHPFGALSSPVRNWFESYFVPGTLTVGLNVRVVRQQWDGERSIRASLAIEGEHRAAVLAATVQSPRKARWRGKEVPIIVRGDRCAEVLLEPGPGVLEIT